MRKKTLCYSISFILSFLLLANPVFATSTKSALSAKQKEKEKTEANIANLNEQISDLAEKKESVNEELDALGAQLLDLLTSISICKDEINDKEQQVKQAKADLKEAETAEEQQYEDMKTRMKFMYEKGESAYLQVCLESKSISEMVNKADYVEKVYDYDRELLTKYQGTKDAVAGLKEKLEEEEAELLACQCELEEEQNLMEQTIAQKEATVANFDAQLANAQAQVSNYKTQLKKQTSEIKQLETKQKEEEAAKAAAAANKNNTATPKSGAAAPKISGGSANGQAIANYACQFVGCPYVFGGTSLTNGTDCSGFTKGVYAHFGITLPRDSTSQRSVGREVSYAEAQPGDIVCYAGHVAIYLGGGNIVHASSAKTGIKYGTATYRTILSIRRIV